MKRLPRIFRRSRGTAAAPVTPDATTAQLEALTADQLAWRLRRSACGLLKFAHAEAVACDLYQDSDTTYDAPGRLEPDWRYTYTRRSAAVAELTLTWETSHGRFQGTYGPGAHDLFNRRYEDRWTSWLRFTVAGFDVRLGTDCWPGAFHDDFCRAVAGCEELIALRATRAEERQTALEHAGERQAFAAELAAAEQRAVDEANRDALRVLGA